jgi:hypothetical protein
LELFEAELYQRQREQATEGEKSSDKAKATRTNNHNPSHKAKFCPYFATKHKNPNKYTPKARKRNTREISRRYEQTPKRATTSKGTSERERTPPKATPN